MTKSIQLIAVWVYRIDNECFHLYLEVEKAQRLSTSLMTRDVVNFPIVEFLYLQDKTQVITYCLRNNWLVCVSKLVGISGVCVSKNFLDRVLLFEKKLLNQGQLLISPLCNSTQRKKVSSSHFQTKNLWTVVSKQVVK